ncbi:hypothetical protein BaRGS_00016868 [Batillaria attramentaria]|uniref:RRM domain-containing protein n=1 Tax=Batillaria attramentaria TaxID=370345 RepID=A0ABD0KX70_9CAEN
MATSSEAHMEIQGFTVVPVRFDASCQSQHYLYTKKHTTRETDEVKPREKTLFVLNVPPYATEGSLRQAFSCCGKVMKVYLHDKPTKGEPPVETSQFFPEHATPKGFKVAYIVFKRSDSVQKALTLPYSKPLLLSTAENPVVTGIEKWKQHYLDQTTDVAEMKKEVTRFMEEYDKKVEEEQKQAKEMDGVPDDDGWITVTRVGKNKGAPRTEAEEKRVTIKDRKKRKEKELVNFYSFQIRESKKQHIVELRKKFEEDKQRIAMMKAARKFRPY